MAVNSIQEQPQLLWLSTEFVTKAIINLDQSRQD